MIQYENLKDVILIGDALTNLGRVADEQVDCIVTSPPYYGLRDYGVSGQIGLEQTVDEYISKMVELFREARRVLKDDGTLWLNLGDSYFANRSQNGVEHLAQTDKSIPGQEIHLRASDMSGQFKPKDLMMIPARVAIALQADGWYLRSQIIWHKPSCMPESVKDRPTNDYELVYLLSKSERYFYNQDAIREPYSENTHGGITGVMPHQKTAKVLSNYEKSTLGLKHDHPKGRNARTVWSINPKGFSGAHFATMPVELAEKCVKAGCPKGGVVLDPFGGAGTTAIAALNNLSHYLLIELNPSYVGIAQERIKVKKMAGVQLGLFEAIA